MNNQKTSAGQLTELLQKLSEIEPAVCRADDYSDGHHYSIGDYGFWLNSFGEFEASYKATVARGPAALDWLAGAIQRAIEARGWDYNHVTQGGYHFVTIYNSALETGFDSPNDCTIAAESMLAAFVAAVEPANR